MLLRALCLLIVWPLASADDKAPLAPLEARLKERLVKHHERAKFPGATVGFVRADGSTGAVAIGVSHKASQTPMKPHDRMFSGSIGKTYVAVVTLLLNEEGKADLDQKLSHWLGQEPWFDRLPNAREITLRMLLNHTSGVPEHVYHPEFKKAIAADPQKVWKPAELVSYILDKKPPFAAGQGWSYADTNYILVGMVIEKITGRTYYQELTDRVLTKYKLDATSPADRPELPGLVSGYTRPNGVFPVPAEVATNGKYVLNPQLEWTGGGLVSTALDLARWAKLLYAGNVLKEATRQQMLTMVPAKALGPKNEYGLGAMRWQSRHGEVIGHSGFFPGYLSTMAYYPKHKLAVAVQLNSDERGSIGLMRAMLDDVVDELLAEKGTKP